jgi:hypothetical protein
MTETIAKTIFDWPGRHKSAQELLDAALDANGGNRGWRLWKETHVKEIVEVCKRAERMSMLDISLGGDLDLAYEIRQPVPLLPRPDGQLVIGKKVIYHLHFEEDWSFEPPAPWEILGVIQPKGIWHPNVSPTLDGRICLGTFGEKGKAAEGSLSRMSPKEILMAGFFAVQLDNLVLDERDPNGILNPIACSYFRDHDEYLPLTRAGLFEPWNDEEE